MISYLKRVGIPSLVSFNPGEYIGQYLSDQNPSKVQSRTSRDSYSGVGIFQISAIELENPRPLKTPPGDAERRTIIGEKIAPPRLLPSLFGPLTHYI